MHFNGTELVGLTVTRLVEQDRITATSVRLQDTAYAGKGSLSPKDIRLECSIQGSPSTQLDTRLDAIKKVLNIRVDGNLQIEDDRYWVARFERWQGERRPLLWSGTLRFTAYDPLAYSTTETESPYSITTSPQTVTETASGTADARPVFTLTASATAASVTVKNVTTDEEARWPSSLAINDILIIDSQNYHITLNGDAAMAAFDGEFPRLVPGNNELTVTGFTGSLTVKYRGRFL